ARLAPDLVGGILVRRRQPARTTQARTQALRDLLRGHVSGRDAVDELVPAQMGQGPVDGRRQGLGRVAPAPCVGMEHVADLVARPAVGLPWPALAEPAAAVAIDEGEHAETLD